MTTREKAPTILTAEGARRKIARLRDSLALSDDLLVDLYEGRAWEVLGHKDWAALCAAEIPELRMLKMRAPERKARAQALRAAGASIPEIVKATGSSLGAIHRDLTPPKPAEPFQMETPHPVDQPAPPAKPEARVATILRLAGAGPLTVAGLKQATGWGHQEASPALSRLAASGRLVYRPGGKRGQMGSYVLPV